MQNYKHSYVSYSIAINEVRLFHTCLLEEIAFHPRIHVLLWQLGQVNTAEVLL